MPRKKDLPYKTENNVFAKRLRDAMNMRGESQTSLAPKVNLTRQTISLYMNGQSVPNTEGLTSMAKALEVSADYLLGLSPVASPDNNIRFICKYTGLSQSSVEALAASNRLCKPLSTSALNLLFSSNQFDRITADLATYFYGWSADLLPSEGETVSPAVENLEYYRSFIKPAMIPRINEALYEIRQSLSNPEEREEND